MQLARGLLIVLNNTFHNVAGTDMEYLQFLLVIKNTIDMDSTTTYLVSTLSM